MSHTSGRAFPFAAALALIGAAAGLGGLLLPWYQWNLDGLVELARSFGLSRAASAPGVTPEQLEQTLAAQLQSMSSVFGDAMVGYRLLSPLALVAHVAAGVAVLWTAVGTRAGEPASKFTGVFVAAGLVFVGRAVWAMTRVPGSAELSQAGINAPLLQADTGVWVVLGGGVALLVAAVAATLKGSAAVSTGWSPAPDAVPGSAHVPLGLTSAQPVAPQSYAAAAVPPPPPPFMPAAPSQYSPDGAYGSEGPSTLDRDSRLLRPNDPYAPPPRAEPAVPIMPVPAEILPLLDPSPAPDLPGAIYGVPRPQAPSPAQQPQRSGSQPPPGFA